MHFMMDYRATIIVLASSIVFSLMKIWIGTSRSPALLFSKVSYFKHASWRTSLANYLPLFHFVALSCLIVAFIDPHVIFPKPSFNSPKNLAPTEGLAIYLVLDQSGSMAQKVLETEDHHSPPIAKIALLKKITQQFIKAHPSDLIGLVSFARVPRILVPLTLDHETLLKELDQLQTIKTPEEDGTAIGYAIFKTGHLISATRYFAEELQQKGERLPYTIKSAVIIVVTDGFQDPNHLDQGNRLRTIELDDAAAYTQKEGIRLYVINIDPALGSSEYAPHRRQLAAITASTGGKFYLVNNQQALQDIYTHINQLEKGMISQVESTQISDEENYDRFSLYPFFLILGLISLLLALILDSFVLKRIP